MKKTLTGFQYDLLEDTKYCKSFEMKSYFKKCETAA